jgi:hypothetical protein
MPCFFLACYWWVKNAETSARNCAAQWMLEALGSSAARGRSLIIDVATVSPADVVSLSCNRPDYEADLLRIQTYLLLTCAFAPPATL